ncbi:hypothetical protein C8J56DRAFT_851366 [Mycena floridula]|nr:hypothetical protein C8J56DRAFT_851366 [Mycena floridula]
MFPSRLVALTRPAICRRQLHATAISLKKKQSRVVIENLWDDDGQVQQPVDNTLVLKNTPVEASSALPVKRKGLTPEARLRRFQNLYAFAIPRLGRRPEIKLPMKYTTWNLLISMANNEEQLEKIVDLFPKYKDGGKQLTPQASELFVRRCEELHCPLLALKAFGDYPKYGVNLTLRGAQQLLHSLHMEYPIENVMTASALYHVYGLPPIANDLVSCSLLMAACWKTNSPESLAIAQQLGPHLRHLLQQQDPSTMTVSNNPVERAKDKPRVWAKWCLKKIDKALAHGGTQRAKWLMEWRAESGHIHKGSAW